MLQNRKEFLCQSTDWVHLEEHLLKSIFSVSSRWAHPDDGTSLKSINGLQYLKEKFMWERASGKWLMNQDDHVESVQEKLQVKIPAGIQLAGVCSPSKESFRGSLFGVAFWSCHLKGSFGSHEMQLEIQLRTFWTLSKLVALISSISLSNFKLFEFKFRALQLEILNFDRSWTLD